VAWAEIDRRLSAASLWMLESFVRLFAVLAVWWLLVAVAYALVPIDGHERSFSESAGGALFVGFISVGAFVIGALTYLPAIRLLAGNPHGRRWRLVALGWSPVVGAVWLIFLFPDAIGLRRWDVWISALVPSIAFGAVLARPGTKRCSPPRSSAWYSSPLWPSCSCQRSLDEKWGPRSRLADGRRARG
jgi:hypothetical protein